MTGGSHSCGIGLKLSFRARTEASEFRRDLCSVGTHEKLSIEATRDRDMLLSRSLL